jgi:hypothetical protein
MIVLESFENYGRIIVFTSACNLRVYILFIDLRLLCSSRLELVEEAITKDHISVS